MDGFYTLDGESERGARALALSFNRDIVRAHTLTHSHTFTRPRTLNALMHMLVHAHTSPRTPTQA